MTSVDSTMQPSSSFVAASLPLEDPNFLESVEDFLAVFSDQELQEEPLLRSYITEQLARWGRWMVRGRAPALCFEAACVGAAKFLEKRGLGPSERTAKADAALARALAGIVIDAVEPLAAEQGAAVREKAVGIVADEFLARATAPRIAGPAKRRIQKRKSEFRKSSNGQRDDDASSPMKEHPDNIDSKSTNLNNNGAGNAMNISNSATSGTNASAVRKSTREYRRRSVKTENLQLDVPSHLYNKSYHQQQPHYNTHHQPPGVYNAGHNQPLFGVSSALHNQPYSNLPGKHYRDPVDASNRRHDPSLHGPGGVTPVVSGGHVQSYGSLSQMVPQQISGAPYMGDPRQQRPARPRWPTSETGPGSQSVIPTLSTSSTSPSLQQNQYTGSMQSHPEDYHQSGYGSPSHQHQHPPLSYERHHPVNPNISNPPSTRRPPPPGTSGSGIVPLGSPSVPRGRPSQSGPPGGPPPRMRFASYPMEYGTFEDGASGVVYGAGVRTHYPAMSNPHSGGGNINQPPPLIQPQQFQPASGGSGTYHAQYYMPPQHGTSPSGSGSHPYGTKPPNTGHNFTGSPHKYGSAQQQQPHVYQSSLSQQTVHASPPPLQQSGEDRYGSGGHISADRRNGRRPSGDDGRSGYGSDYSPDHVRGVSPYTGASSNASGGSATGITGPVYRRPSYELKRQYSGSESERDRSNSSTGIERGGLYSSTVMPRKGSLQSEGLSMGVFGSVGSNSSNGGKPNGGEGSEANSVTSMGSNHRVGSTDISGGVNLSPLTLNSTSGVNSSTGNSFGAGSTPGSTTETNAAQRKVGSTDEKSRVGLSDLLQSVLDECEDYMGMLGT